MTGKNTSCFTDKSPQNMTKDDTEMVVVVRLLVALLAGAMVGYERSYHGRPAGLREI
jgi:hypothetical protein